MLQLYKNIKERRTELHLTQSELADKMGYADKSMIAKIEKGSIDLTQSKIIAFAKALETTPSDLMGWETERQQVERTATFKRLKAYHRLLAENQKKVDDYIDNLLSIQDAEEEVQAAHERTDIEVTDEMRKHDDDLMDGEW